MSPSFRKHKIKQVDDSTWSLHVNDHVLIEWVREGDIFQIDILLTIGPFIIDCYISPRGQHLNEWELTDAQFIGQTDFGKDVMQWDFDNVCLPIGLFPDLHTYLKMAREKGAF